MQASCVDTPRNLTSLLRDKLTLPLPAGRPSKMGGQLLISDCSFSIVKSKNRGSVCRAELGSITCTEVGLVSRGQMGSVCAEFPVAEDIGKDDRAI